MKKNKYLVLVTWPVQKKFLSILRKQLGKRFRVQVASSFEPEKIARQAEKVHVIIAGYLPENAVLSAQNLRLVHSMIKSTNRINKKLLEKKGIALSNTSSYVGSSVAEFVIAQLVIVSRNLPRYFKTGQLDKQWSKNHGACELDGKTIGILGVGEVGLSIAKKAKALGMKVLGFDDNFKQIKRQNPGLFAALGGKKMLPRVLSEPDFVVNALSKTPQTIGFLDTKRLSRLKKTAYLVDCSRGGITDTKALYRLLKKKKIRAAAMDVFDPEPPNPKNPIFKRENFFYTPHIAGVTNEAEERSAQISARTIKQFFKKEHRQRNLKK